MADVEELDGHIQYGRGIAGEILGEPYDFYRLNANSIGDFIDQANLVEAGVSIYIRGSSAKDTREGLETDPKLGTMWMQPLTDMTDFFVGDVFLLNDPDFPSAGYHSVSYGTTEIVGYCLASNIRIRKRFAARLNTFVQIARQDPENTGDGYSSRGQDSALPLLLQGGQFLFGISGEAGASIPVGLISNARTYGEKYFDGVPGEQRKSAWYCYVPPLPGFRFREDDKIIVQDGSRYRVLVAYDQEVGVVGSQLYLEREISIPDQ